VPDIRDKDMIKHYMSVAAIVTIDSFVHSAV